MAQVSSIRHEPEVETRWGVLEAGELEEFLQDEKTFVIEAEGEIVGAIQYDEETDPMSAGPGSTSS